MKKYVIVTDSGSDLSVLELRKSNVISLPLSVKIRDEEREDYAFSPAEFYKMMRGGDTAKTSAVNYKSFLDKFRSIAASGKDALYIGLSSGISSTFSSAKAAADRIPVVSEKAQPRLLHHHVVIVHRSLSCSKSS